MRKWVLVIILLVGLVLTACAAVDLPFLSSEEDEIEISEIVFLDSRDPASFAYPAIATREFLRGVMLYPSDSENGTVKVGWVFLPFGESYFGVKEFRFTVIGLGEEEEDKFVEVRLWDRMSIEEYLWVWRNREWVKIILEDEDWWHALASETYQFPLKDLSDNEYPIQDISLSFGDLDLAAVEFIVYAKGPVTISNVELVRDVERVKEWEEFRQLLEGK